MIQILESKLTNVSKNKYQEIKISFLIKKEDYNNEMEENIYSLCENGSIWALVFNPIELTDNKSKSELLSTLHFFMEKYSEKEWTDINKYKQDIYQEFWVKSRSELSTRDIWILIERYKTGLIFN